MMLSLCKIKFTFQYNLLENNYASLWLYNVIKYMCAVFSISDGNTGRDLDYKKPSEGMYTFGVPL